MPPPSDHPSLRLQLLEGYFAVEQFKAGTAIPAHLLNLLLVKDARAGFISITRTEEEVSLVYDTTGTPQAAIINPSWRCIKIKGPMDFTVTGVMCDFTTPLKKAGIPIFALSTWNTDYILVPKEKATDAKAALEDDGWEF